MNTSRVTEGLAHTKQERLYFLDWLRVLAVLGVFFFHTLRPFDFLGDWNVLNTDRSLVLTYFWAFFFFWGMPLLFLLAGAASWFALRSRPGRQFLRERSVRLLIPLFVGFLLLGPPQAYVEALTHGRFAGSFFQFLPGFLSISRSVGIQGGSTTSITSGFWPSSGCIACSRSPCSCSCE